MNPRFTIHDSRFTWLIVAAALFTIYAATLAPTVTLWDSGEFNAAIASLGIPHPPGTPLYVLIANLWSRVLPLPQALAVNLLSAVATAIACGLLGGLLARWTHNRPAGVAAGLTAGTMLAVWQNATETEVYAVSMLLAVLMVVVGDRAGEKDSARLRLLLAYLMALAVPIQVSALVAAPAAILLAASTPGRTRPDPRTLLALGGVLAIVAGVSQGSPLVEGAGAVAILGSFVGARDGPRLRIEALGMIAIALAGMSATFFMLVRAGHDPLVNQGNPATIDAMMNVVWRRQYPLAGIWPRQAPVWIQLMTLFQYADWQVASGIDNVVSASWWRTPWSVVAAFLAVAGARWHWRQDIRSARGFGLLLLMSSLGVVAVLNLRAGPSILDQILPPGATHEPRERDYFFALAFATAGAWTGAGVVVAFRRWLSVSSTRLVTGMVIALAGLPALLNWRAANRRPEGMIAPTLGEALLASAPPNAVLLLSGDNDSYTTWYRQSVLGERRDVVPVTLSLLPADWYRAELARRYRLLDQATVETWRGEPATIQALVSAAIDERRPVAAAVTVPVTVREAIGPAWTMAGMAYVVDWGSARRPDAVDSLTTRRVADLISARIPNPPREHDPATTYVSRVLRCPSQALRLGTPSGEPSPDALLDSRCNFK
ncbi:MAG TPA: DUF2723 domain-containing protein [Gemmatimonadaceae bacterium]|nr:DUF2723 domain-containing protein [Gemmatimonadaceae bacterium]